MMRYFTQLGDKHSANWFSGCIKDGIFAYNVLTKHDSISWYIEPAINIYKLEKNSGLFYTRVSLN